MRKGVTLACVGMLAFAGSTVGVPAVSSATDNLGTVISVSADPGPFVVDGPTASAASTITAVIDEPGGVVGPYGVVGSNWYYPGVQAVLTRTSGGPWANALVDLRLSSAVGTLGTYTAQWRVASTMSGTWTLSQLLWCYRDATGGTGCKAVDALPGVTQTVTVTGTHPPTATLARIPRTVAYGARQWLQITYRTSSGAPLVGFTVVHSSGLCYQTPLPPQGNEPASYATSTDALGRVTIPLRAVGTCLSLLSPPAVAGDQNTTALIRQDLRYRSEFYKSVTATPSASVIRVGRTLTVTGSVYPAVGYLSLQRLVGGRWHTMTTANATAHVRLSGHYTASAQVPAVGRNTFRVLLLGVYPNLAGTASRPFVVVGLRP